MEEEIEKKIKDLKEFIKQKTDQGTANYLGKEIRELCGMVETQALSQHDVSGRSEQFYCVSSDSLVHGKSCEKWCGNPYCKDLVKQ